MLSDLAYSGTDVQDGDRQSERGVPSHHPESVQEQARIPAAFRVGDYEISGGRLLQHVCRPFREERVADLGPALYCWPSGSGFWLESARGGFGLPGIDDMRRDAWAHAVPVLLRRYGPEPGKVKSVLDYVWQTHFHRVAATPFGLFEAESPEAFEALEACAVRRGC